MTIQHVEELRDGQLVPYFLMASFLYYHCDISPFSDTDFDQLCIRLLGVWSSVKHPHKKLIKKADLAAGTGYSLRLQDYPLQVRHAAYLWSDELELLKESI